MKVILTTEIQIPEGSEEQAREWMDRELSLLTAVRISDARDRPLKNNPLSDLEVEWDKINYSYVIEDS